MKRSIDIFFSFVGLLLVSPVLLIFMYLVYRQDRHTPLYIAPRIGKFETIFKMVKLRSMISGADINGIDSTAINDLRITQIGKIVRKYKLDELTQLWNVLKGDMSLVGPRPNVMSGFALYTEAEKKLLSVRPGITDFSSIIFSDEGEILKGMENPDLAYHQLIRPWKSRLGLIYIENQTNWLDTKIVFYTLVSFISRKSAIKWVAKQLESIGVDPDLIKVARRECKLYPHPPPGMDEIVMTI